MGAQIEHLRGIFRANESKPYLISAHHNLTLSYGETLQRSRRLAAWLSQQGIKSGDRIGFISRNSIDLALLYFAAWHAGAQVVPVNPQLNAQHLKEIVEAAAPALIFADSQTAADIKALTVAPVIAFNRYEDGGDAQLQDVYANAALDADAPEAFGGHENDDTAFLRIYTSGSTKKPKGIDISYAGLIGNERVFCETLGIDGDNRFYNILPMSYLGGVHNLLLLPASVGGAVVIDEPLGGANLYAFWETVRERDINTLWFTSAMLSMLLALRDEDEKSWLSAHIKIGLVGMAPLSPLVKRQFEDRFGFMLYENFAMSETTFLTTNKPAMEYRAGSSGVILPHVTINILDMNDKLVVSGSEGQVVAHTPYMMLGYIDAPQEDLDNLITENGRVCGIRTGDLGRIDNGELFITGRVKDLIIRGGLNISPAQVEAALLEVEGIAEAAAVGAPHEVYGEEVVAAVTLKSGAVLTEKDILMALESKIAHFMRPKQVLIVQALPKGLTMKVDKKLIRALFTAAISKAA